MDGPNKSEVLRKRDGVYPPSPLSDSAKPFSEKIPLPLGTDAKRAHWSEGVKAKDGYICTHPGCGETERIMLESHHIIPRSEREELQYNLDNGETLCLWHHAYRHCDNIKTLNMIRARLCVILYRKIHPGAT